MASQTTEHNHPATRQAHSPGVVMQGAPRPTWEPVGQTEPVLVDDIDPVLLVRLYPEEVNLAGAKTAALAAGKATQAAGVELEMSRIEFDPAAAPVQRKQAAVARAQAAVKEAEHGTPEQKAAAAAELKRAQAMPDDAQKKAAASAQSMPG